MKFSEAQVHETLTRWEILILRVLVFLLFLIGVVSVGTSVIEGKFPTVNKSTTQIHES